MRVCSEPGCHELIEQGKCATHRRNVEVRRGSKQARGYGPAHAKLRASWAPKVAAGRVTCWRCKERISPLEPWDLGHLDDRSGYGGPEHPLCNRATAGR